MATQVTHITIDKFGRVVLPKEIRDRFSIREGTEFEVNEQEDVILLRPVEKQAKVVKKNGWFVIQTGKNLPEDIILKTIEKVREERNREIVGSPG